MASLTSAADLLRAAERHLLEEEYEASLDAASRALEISLRDGDQVGEADALRLKVGSMRVAALYLPSSGEVSGSMSLSEAEKQRKAALEAAESLAETEQRSFASKGNKRGEAVMLLAAADVMHDQRRAEEGKNLAEQALAALRVAGDKRMEANALLTLVYLHARLGEGEKAADIAAEALQAFRETGDSTGEARVLHAQAALAEGLRKDGVPFAKEAAELFKQAGCKKMHTSELQSIAQWYLWNHMPKEALPFALESHKLFKEISGDVDMQSSASPGMLRAKEANAMDTVVKCLTGKEDFQRALKWCKDAVEESKAQSDDRAQVMALHTLIFTQIDQDCHCCYPGDFAEALKAAEEGVSLCQKLGNKSWEASMHHSAAQAHYVMERYELAAQEARSSARMFKELGDIERQARVLRTLADIHSNGSEFNKALAAAQEALDIWQELQNRSKEASSWLLMADIQHAKETRGQQRTKRLGSGQHDSVTAALQALAIFQEGGEVRKAVAACGSISMYYKDKGNLQDAVHAAEVAAEICQMDRDYKLQARCFQHAAHLLVERHPGAASSAAEQALAAARLSRSRRLEIEGLILVAQTFTAKAAKESLENSNGSKDALLFKTELQALRPAREAVALARKLVGKPTFSSFCHCFHLPHALYALGEVHLLGGKGEDALRAAEEAEASYEAEGDVPGRATCLLLAAQAHSVCGRSSDADRVANQALGLFTDCGDERGQARANEVLQSFKKQTAAVAALTDLGAAHLAASEAMGEIKKMATLDLEYVREEVFKTVGELATEDADNDSPLMDLGIDSLSAVSFAEELSKKFNIRLGAQALFDYPNVRSVAEFIVAESQVPM